MLDNSDFDRPMASMAERTAIVAWLRAQIDEWRSDPDPVTAQGAQCVEIMVRCLETSARAIERGDHLPRTQPVPPIGMVIEDGL